MRIASLLLLAIVTLPAFAEPAVVRGTVTVDGTPLPGVTVRYEAGIDTRITISDAHGAYRFANVIPGKRTITFELEGLVSAARVVDVLPGENEVPPLPMQVALLTEPITIHTCLPCSPKPPRRESDPVSCDDYVLDQALIANAAHGDPAAVQALRDRHAETLALGERLRIDEALLRIGGDDHLYWNEVLEHARRALRFRDPEEGIDPEVASWCTAHDAVAQEYLQDALAALTIAIADPRGRSLALEALHSTSEEVVQSAIAGLTRHVGHGADSPLPAPHAP